MSSIVYVIEGGDREDELEEHVLKIKFSLDILKKYINHGKSLPLDGDENLILPLKLPKNINIHQLSKFFEFFKENKKNKKPIAKTVLKGQQHKNFVYVYANVDDEKKALQEHYTQFSSFVREMDDQLLLQIYQLVGHLHCDRLQKILMVFLRERQPKKITEELKSDPNEVKQITEELKVVPTNEEMLVIGSSFVKTKILDPLYKMFNSNTCRSIAFSNRDRGFIDCWYPLMSSLQSNDYQKMQAELINWHLESYLEARDKRLGNDKWKGLTQYFFWTNLRTKVTSLVKKDIWDFLDTIRKKCLHIRENELTKHKIYKFECVTPETIQLPKGLTEHLIEKNLEADNVWISIGDGTHAYMARLSDTTIQEWGLLLIDKKS